MQAVKYEILGWAGLMMLALRLRRWLNISPLLNHSVVFGATQNVGQP